MIGEYMEIGTIATFAGLGSAVIGLLVTLITVAKKMAKEKKEKLRARAETEVERLKTQSAQFLAERLKIVTDAVTYAVGEVEKLKTETSGRLPAKVKRTLGIVMALDECLKANVCDVSREELGAMVDSLVGFTKTVNAKESPYQSNQY
jgi:hypothetical protein